MVLALFAYRQQPWKFLYLASQMALIAFLKLPIWFITNIPTSMRPDPRWPIYRVIIVNIMRLVFMWSYIVGPVKTPPSFEALVEGEGYKGVWVKPVPELVVGEIKEAAEKNGVSSIPLPGYWLTKPGAHHVKPGSVPLPGEKVVYCLHGGGYVSFTAHPSDYTSNIARGLLQHCSSITSSFSIEYRLTRGAPLDATGAFPSALMDALAGYAYLVNDVGFDPKDIILEGDSAGGNLAMALARYLVEYSADYSLPAPPGTLILLSPLVDMGSSHRGSDSFTRCIKTDYITNSPERWKYLANAFTGALGVESVETNRFISAGSKNKFMKDVSFKGFPPTLVTAGENELLRDAIVYLKDKMAKDIENVGYIETPSAVHDVVILEFFEPERTDTLHAIAKWVEAL